eukprot:scaffold147245_cov17-Prasinocladus_malaysianus.AAC.1
MKQNKTKNWPFTYSAGVAADESLSPLFTLGFPLGFCYALMPTPVGSVLSSKRFGACISFLKSSSVPW